MRLSRQCFATNVLALCLLPFSSWGFQVGQTPAVAEIGPSGLGIDCSFHGPVKSIKIRESEVERKSPQEGHVTAFCTFQRDGQPLESFYFRDDGQYGKSSQRFVNTYDSKGELRETDLYSNEIPKHPNRHLLKRDSAGRVSETQDFDADGSLSNRTVYRRDTRGNTIEEIGYDWNGRMTDSLKRTFDAANRVQSEESRDVHGTLRSKRKYVYDANGRISDEPFQYGKDSGRYLFHYTEQGWLQSSETQLDDGGPTEMPNLYGRCGDCGLFPGKTLYLYTPEGYAKEQQMIQFPDQVMRLSRYDYDVHGRRTQEWVYEQNGSKDIRLELNGREIYFGWTNGLPMATYTYDARGNWTKAVVTTTETNGAPPSERQVSGVFYRELVYR